MPFPHAQPLHPEYNPSSTEPGHLLQIWILPRQRGLTPGYTEWKPGKKSESAPKALLISAEGRDDSATIAQDADVWRVRLQPGESISHFLAHGRGLWLQLISGELEIGGDTLLPGDAVSTETPGILEFRASHAPVEALLFDLG